MLEGVRLSVVLGVPFIVALTIIAISPMERMARKSRAGANLVVAIGVLLMLAIVML